MHSTESDLRASSIVLRFRDLVVPRAGHTISEHNKISEVHGYTWWGWWKKQSEKIPAELWSDLRRATSAMPIQIFLVDSGQKIVYRAQLFDIKFEPGQDLTPAPEDGEKTPDYYQSISKPAPFASWFKIGPITEADETVLHEYAYAEVPRDPYVSVAKDRIVGKRIAGISQLLQFGNVTYWAICHASQNAEEAGPFYTRVPPAIAADDIVHVRTPYILHISDLHFSSKHHAFATENQSDLRPSLASAIVSAVGSKKPGAVIVTGDLTWTGDKAEFDLARESLDALRSEFGLTPQHFVIVPGNHDLGWVRKDGDGERWDGAYELADEQAKTNYRHFIEDWYKARFDDSLALGRRFCIDGGGTLDVLGLNTSALQQVEGRFAGLGSVPSLTFRKAADKLGWRLSNRASQRRFLAVHHHLLPVVAQEDPSAAKAGFGMMLDAGSQLVHCAEYGIDMVVHGHQHQPFAGYFSSLEMNGTGISRGVHILGGGSAGVTDHHLGPIKYRTFHLLSLSHDSAVIEVELYATEKKASEFRCISAFKTGAHGWTKGS